MFASASSGTGYTAMIAYLAAGFIFIPAVLVASRPFGYPAIFLAIGGSMACAALAWANWKSSRVSGHSIISRKKNAK